MNRKTFLASLAGLAATPILGKAVRNPDKELVCTANEGKIKGILFGKDCYFEENPITGSMQLAFHNGRKQGAMDFRKESAINDAIVTQDELNKRIFDELSKTD